MEGFKFLIDFRRLIPCLAIVLMIFGTQVSGQINTACSSAMLRSFGPCINFMNNNGSGSPTSACCQSLKELTASGTDCLCLIVTGNVSFKIPNRNVAITLPKACNKDSVPIECKGKNQKNYQYLAAKMTIKPLNCSSRARFLRGYKRHLAFE